MREFVLIIMLGIIVAGLVLGYWALRLQRKVRRLEKREMEAIKIIVEDVRKINLLQEGDSMYVDQKERLMLLSALEYVPFREAVELPETKHNVRQVYRRVREKLQLLIRAYSVPDKMDITPDPPEVKEDDEIKEVPK